MDRTSSSCGLIKQSRRRSDFRQTVCRHDQHLVKWACSKTSMGRSYVIMFKLNTVISDKGLDISNVEPDNLFRHITWKKK